MSGALSLLARLVLGNAASVAAARALGTVERVRGLLAAPSEEVRTRASTAQAALGDACMPTIIMSDRLG